MPSGGSSGGTSTVTQNADPWSGVQPYLKQQLQQAQQLYNNSTGQPSYNNDAYDSALQAWQSAQDSQGAGKYQDANGNWQVGQNPSSLTPMPSLSDFMTSSGASGSQSIAPAYFPGQTVASQSPQTQQAISALTAQATSPQEMNLQNANAGQITDTLNGNYLDPSTNPYFKGALNNIADAYARGTGAQTDAAFNRSGSYGGSAYNETKGANNQAFAKSLMDLGNTQYQQGRTNQLQASALAPGASQIPYSNIAQLANAGSSMDQYNQNLINANMNKYSYNANLPYNALQRYASLITNPGTNSSTTTTPYYQNNLANGLGLGTSVLGGLNALNGLGVFGSAAGAAGIPAGASLVEGLPWLAAAA